MVSPVPPSSPPPSSPVPPRSPGRAVRSSVALARALIVAGIVGIVASLVGIVVVWMLLDDLGDGVDQSIELTTETLTTLDETLVLADAITATVSSSTETLDATVARLSDSVDEGSTVLTSLADLSGEELPASIDGVIDGIDNLAGVARTIDATLTQLSSIPFGPDYDPDNSFSGTLGEIRDNLQPTADELRAIAPDLQSLATTVTESQGDLELLSSDVANLRSSLNSSGPLIAAYRDRVSEAQALAADTQSDLTRDRNLAKIVTLILGLAIAVGQAVPILYGREKLTTTP